MKFKLALIFILLSVSNFSFALYGARALSTPNSFSAVVSLHLNDADYPEYDYFCSGVLIAADKVLTTGHCIEGMAAEVYQKWNLFGYEPHLLRVKANGVKLEVADVMISPTYFEGAGFEGEDLAIVKLKRPVSIKPLKIASKNALRAGQGVAMVARHQIAFTTIKALRSYSGNTVIFTDGSRAGVCVGDSGGALLILQNGEYQLAGILSAQRDNCEKHTGVSVFPRVAF